MLWFNLTLATAWTFDNESDWGGQCTEKENSSPIIFPKDDSITFQSKMNFGVISEESSIRITGGDILTFTNSLSNLPLGKVKIPIYNREYVIPSSTTTERSTSTLSSTTESSSTTATESTSTTTESTSTTTENSTATTESTSATTGSTSTTTGSTSTTTESTSATTGSTSATTGSTSTTTESTSATTGSTSTTTESTSATTGSTSTTTESTSSTTENSTSSTASTSSTIESSTTTISTESSTSAGNGSRDGKNAGNIRILQHILRGSINETENKPFLNSIFRSKDSTPTVNVRIVSYEETANGEMINCLADVCSGYSNQTSTFSNFSTMTFQDCTCLINFHEDMCRDSFVDVLSCENPLETDYQSKKNFLGLKDTNKISTRSLSLINKFLLNSSIRKLKSNVVREGETENNETTTMSTSSLASNVITGTTSTSTQTSFVTNSTSSTMMGDNHPDDDHVDDVLLENDHFDDITTTNMPSTTSTTTEVTNSNMIKHIDGFVNEMTFRFPAEHMFEGDGTDFYDGEMVLKVDVDTSNVLFGDKYQSLLKGAEGIEIRILLEESKAKHNGIILSTLFDDLEPNIIRNYVDLPNFFNIGNVISSVLDSNDYNAYRGSRTVPGCQRPILQVVFKQPILIDSKFINKYKVLNGSPTDAILKRSVQRTPDIIFSDSIEKRNEEAQGLSNVGIIIIVIAVLILIGGIAGLCAMFMIRRKRAAKLKRRIENEKPKSDVEELYTVD